MHSKPRRETCGAFRLPSEAGNPRRSERNDLASLELRKSGVPDSGVIFEGILD